METVILASAESPSLPATAPRRRSVQRWLLGVLGGLVVISAGSLMLEGSTLRVDLTSGNSIDADPRALRLHVASHVVADAAQREELVPSWAADLADTRQVPENERLHLSLLHAACVSEQDAVIPWRHGAPGINQVELMRSHRHDRSANESSRVEDAEFQAELIRQDDPNLLEKLRACPDVDVFLPSSLRGNGYCEDAVAYAKYLNSRLLPMWVFEVKLLDPALGKEVDYFDLCPTTPVIFFNHYWDDLPASPRWPEGSRKPLYLMPNIEMYELSETHLWRADVVLCKTRVCHDRVTRWYEQEGNPRSTKVFYTKHTSSDQAAFARRALGIATDSSSGGSNSVGVEVDAEIAAKDFEYVRFVHTAGTSVWKGTRQIVDCWLSQTGLPPLELFIDDEAFDMLMGKRYNSRLQFTDHPIKVTRGRLDALAFDQLVSDSAFFLCPSIMEGYGHYINQARASGAVIVTTDAHPMNELITSSDMGVLVPARPDTDSNMFLGGGFQGSHGLRGTRDTEEGGNGLVASFSSTGLCRAIKHMVETTTADSRRAMALQAKQAYHQDTKFFARAMAELRVFARSGAALG